MNIWAGRVGEGGRKRSERSLEEETEISCQMAGLGGSGAGTPKSTDSGGVGGGGMGSMSLGVWNLLGMGKGKEATRSWQAPVLGRKVRRGFTLVRFGRNMYCWPAPVPEDRDRRFQVNLYSAGNVRYCVSLC